MFDAVIIIDERVDRTLDEKISLYILRLYTNKLQIIFLMFKKRETSND